MLVLSRKSGEKFWIGDNIAITVVRISGGGVRIGIEAPDELVVMRDELREKTPVEVNTSSAIQNTTPTNSNQSNSKPR